MCHEARFSGIDHGAVLVMVDPLDEGVVLDCVS